MALLDPLLEVQNLDSQADRLKLEKEKLLEREALLACTAEMVANDDLQARASATREELARSEREIAGEVSVIAADAKDVEGRLYSGSVTIPKELEALQEELRLGRTRQAEFEEQELEVMEKIENQDKELGRLAGLRAEAEARSNALQATIADAETRINDEIAELGEKRLQPLAILPAPFAEQYAALREKPRLGGRAAAALRDGLCQACRVSLPRLDLSRILAEPEDALVKCPHCTRLLVR